ncbi:MAG TPA: hypothetical protein VNA29_09940 [Sphingomicrobium sp.]|nr:hypothetical protein [Sphingomicrobium sp.]
MFAEILLTAAIALQASNSNGCNLEQINPATLVHLQMGNFQAAGHTDTAKMVTTSDLSISANGGKVLGYTRIGVRYKSCGGLRDLTKERRDALKRFFFGKHATKLLTLKLHVRPLDVKATKPLASIKRDSDKKGETWATEIVNDEILLPYFRVDRSSTVAIEASVESDRAYDSSLAGATLDIVQRAAALINPTTALITTENKERFNSAATFVDGAVNGMMAVSIDEKANSRAALDSPMQKQTLAIITLKLPMANNTFGSTRFPMQEVGQWEVYAETYRPSMLADLTSPSPIPRNETSVASVLNYLVDDKKTIRESLAASKSLASSRDALVAATKPDDVTNKARTLCRAVASEAEALGLTPVDVGAVAWAYLADLALEPSKNSAAESGCSVVELYPTS